MSTQPSRIHRLIQAARSGEQAAREELFQACRNYVAVIARTQVESWMRTKVDASDLVQQTLLDAHQGFEKFQGNHEGEWLAWLKQILTHNTQDFIRRHRTAKRDAGLEFDPAIAGSRPDLIEVLPDNPITPSQFLMAQERELALADAIAGLPPDYQEVIHLRSLQGLPFLEVAERMGRSRPATQMLWLRAVEKLEERLREAEG